MFQLILIWVGFLLKVEIVAQIKFHCNLLNSSVLQDSSMYMNLI